MFMDERVDEFSVEYFFIVQKIIVVIIVWIEIRIVVIFTYSFFFFLIKVIEVFKFK